LCLWVEFTGQILLWIISQVFPKKLAFKSFKIVTKMLNWIHKSRKLELTRMIGSKQNVRIWKVLLCRFSDSSNVAGN
jgi:hypothetical protein